MKKTHGQWELTKKDWTLIVESLKSAQREAGSMAEERVSGFVDVSLQDELEKPYKRIIRKIRTKGLHENRH